MIPLFDLHCDTFSELYNNNFSLKNSPLHISLDKAKSFSPYIQVCSVWSDCRLSDEDAFFNYCEVIDFLKSLGIKTKKSSKNFSNLSFILGVEDARILNYSPDRLELLYNDGVRVLTLNWAGNSCIGGGWDTSSPLTAFGRAVVEECARLGIIIDISHSSLSVQNEVISLAKKLGFVPIFSHSNSFSVCNHRRNLCDEIFREIVLLNGLVGISLAPSHLESAKNANLFSILKHIDYYFSLGGENCVALGCDFDGVSALPSGVTSVADLDKLYSLLDKEYGTDLANKVFFKNAYKYFTKKLS